MVRAAGILICGGGTGGHVFPGLAVCAAYRQAGGTALRWIGDPQRLEARLVPQADIPLLPFGLDRPRPKRLGWWLRAGLQALRTWQDLRRRPPRVVVALGGYAALLPGLMAPLLRRPLVVLEQNAHPGRTNRLLARFADVVVTQFAEAERLLPRRRVRRLGNPVRSFPQLPRGQGERLQVLVMGGSLAASTLNALLMQAAAELARIPRLHLVHLAGEAEREQVAACYRELGVDAEVLGYCDDMPSLYQRIDLVCGRAGATTVAELCAAGIGALYVPLPWAAEDHQTANARAVARVGGAAVLPQKVLTAAGLARVLRRLAEDRAAVARMGRSATRLARPDAAGDVVRMLQREYAA